MEDPVRVGVILHPTTRWDSTDRRNDSSIGWINHLSNRREHLAGLPEKVHCRLCRQHAGVTGLQAEPRRREGISAKTISGIILGVKCRWVVSKLQTESGAVE